MKIKSTYRRFIAALIVMVFSLSAGMPPGVYAQGIANLPAPGTMLSPSVAYTPAIVAGITIYPDDPLRFDFIIDTGDDNLQGEELRQESQKLINYFLATLTVPEDELWVNLSPYEKDRIIADGLGATEMGRDMLAQDYLLKQLTASLMYPEEEIGETFWKKIYEKARARLGTTEIPTNTFNKVWIVPEKAVVYVNGTNAFVSESHLKVMLEEDYLALESNQDSTRHGLGGVTEEDIEQLSAEAKEVIREVIIPEIEKEVNAGKNFANLRQIYNSMILATWYKKNLRESVLGRVYMDKNKVKGIDLSDRDMKEKIYNQYLEAFKKGVYNYIKEDYDPVTRDIIPRMYFSGGMKGTKTAGIEEKKDHASTPIGDRQEQRYGEGKPLQRLEQKVAGIDAAGDDVSLKDAGDTAMLETVDVGNAVSISTLEALNGDLGKEIHRLGEEVADFDRYNLAMQGHSIETKVNWQTKISELKKISSNVTRLLNIKRSGETSGMTLELDFKELVGDLRSFMISDQTLRMLIENLRNEVRELEESLTFPFDQKDSLDDRVIRMGREKTLTNLISSLEKQIKLRNIEQGKNFRREDLVGKPLNPYQFVGAVQAGTVKFKEKIIIESKEGGPALEAVFFEVLQSFSIPDGFSLEILGGRLLRANADRIDTITVVGDQSDIAHGRTTAGNVQSSEGAMLLHEKSFIGLRPKGFSFVPLPGTVQAIDEELSREIFETLQGNGFVDTEGQVTDKFTENTRFEDLGLPDKYAGVMGNPIMEVLREAKLSDTSESTAPAMLSQAIISEIKKIQTGRADPRIVPSGNYSQGVQLGVARTKDFKGGGTLFDFLFKLNVETIGKRALELALNKSSFSGDAEDVRSRYDAITSTLRSYQGIDQLTPPQLGRVIYDIVEELTGDRDPHSNFDHVTVSGFEEIYSSLEEKIGMAELEAEADAGNVTERWKDVLFRAFVYAALSRATDITFFGMKKSLIPVANDLGVSTEGLDFKSEAEVSRFLDKAAAESGIVLETNDIVPVKLMKLAVGIVGDPLTSDKVHGKDAFDLWIDGIARARQKPIVLRTDDKEDFIVMQMKVKALLLAGFNVIVAGAERPVMNDATAEWLTTQLSRLEDLQEFLMSGQLKIISNGTGIGGTDLNNTGHEFNDAVVASSSVIAGGSSDAESLIQEDLALPFSVVTVSMSGKKNIDVSFQYQPQATQKEIKLSHLKGRLQMVNFAKAGLSFVEERPKGLHLISHQHITLVQMNWRVLDKKGLKNEVDLRKRSFLTVKMG